MTVDHLISKLNDGWGSASMDVSLRGDGRWTASLQHVRVLGLDGVDIRPPQATAHLPKDAIAQLVAWLRGKRVCLRGTNGSADGPAIKVPKNLKIPRVR